ncbi:MAG: hypothetical protein ACFFG0_11220 [Candidatus Thorarchaeota archaeon]
MRYIILMPDYTGSCIRDEFGEEIKLESLNLPKRILDEINIWHDAYRKIIPLSMEERTKKINEIEKLDVQGLKIAKSLKKLIHGESKVKYFSEGKLKYIYVN